MSLEKRIANKLTVLKPHYLEILNDSAKHLHHKESPLTGESHFTVKISSAKFIGKNMTERHRMINKLLTEEFAAGLHALSIKIIT